MRSRSFPVIVAIIASAACGGETHRETLDANAAQTEEAWRAAIGCFRLTQSNVSAKLWAPTIDSLGVVSVDSLSVSAERPNLRRLRSGGYDLQNEVNFWEVDAITNVVRWHFGESLSVLSFELRPVKDGYEGVVWQKADTDEAPVRVGSVSFQRVPCPH